MPTRNVFGRIVTLVCGCGDRNVYTGDGDVTLGCIRCGAVVYVTINHDPECASEERKVTKNANT